MGKNIPNIYGKGLLRLYEYNFFASYGLYMYTFPPPLILLLSNISGGGKVLISHVMYFKKYIT